MSPQFFLYLDLVKSDFYPPVLLCIRAPWLYCILHRHIITSYYMPMVYCLSFSELSILWISLKGQLLCFATVTARFQALSPSWIFFCEELVVPLHALNQIFFFRWRLLTGRTYRNVQQNSQLILIVSIQVFLLV